MAKVLPAVMPMGGGRKNIPRGKSSSVQPRDEIPTATPMFLVRPFQWCTCRHPIMPHCTENSRWRPKNRKFSTVSETCL